MTKMTKSYPLNSTTQIPAVGFGTYLIDDADAAATVNAAISVGYRHIDTASGYHNESGVGAGLRQAMADGRVSRREMFVTTKLWPGNPAWGQQVKTGDEVLDECRQSLQRLGLDYVDLYLIHAPYAGPDRVAQWRALLDIQDKGLARSIGVSNFTPQHLDEIKTAGLPRPDANQIELHPFSQKPDFLNYMADHDILPIAYSSLVPLSSWRDAPGQDSAKTPDMVSDGAVFAQMAAKYGVSDAQFLLRWGVQSGFVVLPKSQNPGRMRQNLDLDGFQIDDGDMAAIAKMDRGGGVAWASGDPSATV